MGAIKRSISLVLLLCIINIKLIFEIEKLPFFVKVLLFVVSCLYYLLLLIIPRHLSGQLNKDATPRLQILIGGYEQLLLAVLGLSVEIVFYLFWGKLFTFDLASLNLIITLALLATLGWQGVIRMMLLSKQTSIITKLLLLFFWWLPFINIVLLIKMSKKVNREYQVESYHLEMAAATIENKICETRYPIVMVHGIFFRDWQYFNYWGRIPKALLNHGATVFYGKQQSSLPIAESAMELKEQIKTLLAATGAKKVNIIAHSKGGLDSRYAISCLEMAPYIASLTTINTPHRGCLWADKILKVVPTFIVRFIGNRYNSIFKKLGDKNPNFYDSIYDLTSQKSESFNELVLDQPGVYYQSYMSKMKKTSSAPFPLNATNLLIKLLQGENDGLVPVTSGSWGNYLGLLTATKKRGISHGDMIDLNRENIEGFDVRQFYIDLIVELRQKGF